jgi:uncharacterized protein YyaL (SSP411 family)
VDWYPWGEEAFERARIEDKPIFLSIGYATCHWCHVMEHESFEDPSVASLMNQTFVNIKVDREERPDIDQVYMTVCQMLTGSGGWPLTILMTPEKKPFFAATYIPRESRHGRVGMLDLVPRVRQMWNSERDKVLESTQQILGHLQSTTRNAAGGSVDPSIVDTTYHQLGSRYDATDGGFGDKPKFPSPHNLEFLLHYWHRTGQRQALTMVEQTLDAMRHGGIYDHVGFGFHRYSTDSEWLVPHFEKMLYDQATLATAYTEAFLATGDQRHERTARETLSYVLRDMTAPEGGFYSAEDADSEGEEGLFYLWTVDEVREVLGDKRADFVIDLFHMSSEGNYLDEATQQANGSNILHLRESHGAAASRLGMSPVDFEKRLESARADLFNAREQRIHPLKDDKILTDWNGLMAAAMARAGRAFGEPEYLEAAGAAVEFVLGSMRSENGRLMHRYREGSVSVPAFLDDYVFMISACLELYAATLDETHLDRALSLQRETDERFWDDGSGGYFFSADDAEELLVRQKEVYDGAMPSGNSVAMANLVLLGELTGDTKYTQRADAVASAFSADVKRMPSAHTYFVNAVQHAAGPSIEVVIAGDPSDERTRSLISEVRSHYLPHAVILLVPDGKQGAKIRELAPFTKHYSSIEGQPAAFVCRDYECKLPTSDVGKLKELLDEASAQSNPR